MFITDKRRVHVMEIWAAKGERTEQDDKDLMDYLTGEWGVPEIVGKCLETGEPVYAFAQVKGVDVDDVRNDARDWAEEQGRNYGESTDFYGSYYLPLHWFELKNVEWMLALATQEQLDDGDDWTHNDARYVEWYRNAQAMFKARDEAAESEDPVFVKSQCLVFVVYNGLSDGPEEIHYLDFWRDEDGDIHWEAEEGYGETWRI